MTLTITAANAIARELMDQHGLTDWRIAWDNAKRRYGQCQYGPRVLSFSRPLTVLREEDDFRNTVLHEIAHALTPRHNHDRVWKRQFLAIGGDGARCSEGPSLEAPWTGVHDGCSKTYPRHRRMEGAVCPSCFVRPQRPSLQNMMPLQPDNSKAMIRWVRTSSLASK